MDQPGIGGRGARGAPCLRLHPLTQQRQGGEPLQGIGDAAEQACAVAALLGFGIQRLEAGQHLDLERFTGCHLGQPFGTAALAARGQVQVGQPAFALQRMHQAPGGIDQFARQGQLVQPCDLAALGGHQEVQGRFHAVAVFRMGTATSVPPAGRRLAG